MSATSDFAPEAHRYLTDVRVALGDLPPAAVREIHQGLAEELVGLGSRAARVRIEELGDPHQIAAQARAEMPAHTAVHHGETQARIRVESRVYVTLSALTVAFGGLVVPFVGAIVGYIWVWMSRTWTRREKLIATFVPVIACVVFVVSVTWNSPDPDIGGNPLIPASFQIWNVSILFLAANVLVGLALMGVGLRRLTRHQQ